MSKAAATWLLFALAVGLTCLELGGLHLVRPLDNRLLDHFVRSSAAGLAPDPDIVIVDIDDGSLEKMKEVAGSWQWPRGVHAEMLMGMARQKPRAIVFDVTFSEPDKYRPEGDQLLNEALVGQDNVFFPMVRLLPEKDPSGPLVASVAELVGMQRTARADPQARVALAPPQALDAAHWRTGTINFAADADGVGRRYDLYMDVKGWLLPSLPARVAGALGYPVARAPDMVLSWRGGSHPYRRISYADLYHDFGRERPLRAPDELTGKIVVIGTTAASLGDLRPTPIASLYPGAQILATAIDNLKNQSAMRYAPPWTLLAGALLTLALLNRAFARGHSALRIGAVLLVASLALAGASYLAIAHRLLLPIVALLVLVWAYFLVEGLQAYLAERRARKKIVTEFGRFVNPHVVKQLLAGGVLRGGESRDVTVLFSDIRGFTTLSENRSPQEIVQILNRYFTLQVEVIFRHDGSLDKFIGDCIMAFWGAPLDNPRHAHQAVLAALEMAEVLERFKAELGAQDLDFDVGIGIHTGPAVVGLIGSDQRREYTAIGDTVNLASRIEGLTKGVSRILVSRETMQACEGELRFTPFGAFDVKGREQQVELFGPEKGAAT